MLTISTIVLFCSLAITTTVVVGQGHVFRIGDCPEIKSMDPFDLEKFQGTWYITRKFNTMSTCIRENVTREGDNYYINAEMDLLGVPSKQTAKVQFIRYRPESEMRLNFQKQGDTYFPQNYQLGGQNYIVLKTDYSNYALVWSCLNTLLGHRESAQVMSRTPKLSREYMDELVYIMDKMNIESEQMSRISQNSCRWDEYGNFKSYVNKRHQK